jgi:hypothetical protein
MRAPLAKFIAAFTLLATPLQTASGRTTTPQTQNSAGSPIQQNDPSRTFTPHEMANIIVASKSHEDAIYKLASLSFSLHNAERLFTMHPDALLRRFTLAPTSLMDLDYGNKTINEILTKRVKLEDGLRDIAKQKAGALNGRMPGFAMAVDDAAGYLSGKAGVWGKLYKYYLYPSIRDSITNYYRGRDTYNPHLSREFVIANATEAIDKIRAATPIGEALAPYAREWLQFNPKNNLDSHPAVEKAKVQVDKIAEATKTPEDAKRLTADEVGLDTKTIETTRQALKDFQKWMTARNQAEEREKFFKEKAEYFDDTAAGLAVLGYALYAKGNPLGKSLLEASKAFEGLARLAEKSSEMSAGSFLATGLGVLASLVGAIHESNDGESPYPTIFEALQRIYSAVLELQIRQEVIFEPRSNNYQQFLPVGAVGNYN